MTITKCGVCDVKAVGRVEKFVLFGYLKSHMPIVCKGCRNMEVQARRKSKENTFRDRIEKVSVPRPRSKVDARMLMLAFSKNEMHNERIQLNDFIGL
jgi:hypothetical protein